MLCVRFRQVEVHSPGHLRLLRTDAPIGPNYLHKAKWRSWFMTFSESESTRSVDNSPRGPARIVLECYPKPYFAPFESQNFNTRVFLHYFRPVLKPIRYVECNIERGIYLYGSLYNSHLFPHWPEESLGTRATIRVQAAVAPPINTGGAHTKN